MYNLEEVAAVPELLVAEGRAVTLYAEPNYRIRTHHPHPEIHLSSDHCYFPDEDNPLCDINALASPDVQVWTKGRLYHPILMLPDEYEERATSISITKEDILLELALTKESEACPSRKRWGMGVSRWARHYLLHRCPHSNCN